MILNRKEKEKEKRRKVGMGNCLDLIRIFDLLHCCIASYLGDVGKPRDWFDHLALALSQINRGSLPERSVFQCAIILLYNIMAEFLHYSWLSMIMSHISNV